MIETIAQWAIVPAYLTFGVLLARSQAERVYQWRVRENTYGDDRFSSSYMIAPYAPNETRLALVGIALFWPLAFPVLLAIGLLHFMYAPVNNRKERAAKLRADAEHWKREAQDEVDSEKKALAEELARVLWEQAKEVDL